MAYRLIGIHTGENLFVRTVGVGVVAFPNPTLKVASGGIALVGSLCSALSNNLALAGGLQAQGKSKPQYFGLGEGIEANQVEMLREYARKYNWNVMSQIDGIPDGVRKPLDTFRQSIDGSVGFGTSPVFVANTKTGGSLVFQFTSAVHIEREDSGELIINDAGTVYIMGHGNRAYQCRIRVLRFLLDEDNCSWIVPSGTREDGQCNECGCRIFLQEFTNNETRGSTRLSKYYRFGSRNDPQWEAHRAHSGNDPGCKPEVPCTDDSVKM